MKRKQILPSPWRLLELVLVAMVVALLQIKPTLSFELHQLRRNTQASSSSSKIPYVVGDKLSTLINHPATEESAVVPEVITLPRGSDSGNNSNSSNSSSSNVAQYRMQSQYKRYTIMYRKDASYTTVHFSNFNFRSGCTMQVSGKPGVPSTPYKMTGQGSEAVVKGNFWAQHVKGDTMYLDVHCADYDDLQIERDANFVIDQVAVGFVDEQSGAQAQPESSLAFGESVCGTVDFQDAICYVNSDPKKYNAARAVARLLVDGNGLCTGWLVSNQNHFITNEHCIDSNSVALNTDYTFNFEATSCGGNTNTVSTTIKGATLRKLSTSLDYALVQFTTATPATTFGFLSIDPRTDVPINEQIYIPQHPEGRPKELGIVSTHAQDNGLCRLNSRTEPGCGSNLLEYGCKFH